MRLGRALICAGLLALIAAPVVWASEVDESDFRFVRGLSPESSRSIIFEPDGELFAHATDDFADLRFLDADGNQIPWREAPVDEGAESELVQLLNSGRQGTEAVALLDFGPGKQVHDRIELDIPDRNFTGRAVVLGADRREGPFTRLSSTGIYGISGTAQPARSTVAVFAPADFQYLQIRASGVDRIDGATVSSSDQRRERVRREARSSVVSEIGSRTVVKLDLGTRDLPVDQLQVRASDENYVRPVRVSGSNDGRRFAPLAEDAVFRYSGSRSAPIPIDARYRFIRVSIQNGDDDPLSDLRVIAFAQSRAIVVQGGNRGPITVLYGDRSADAASYDFAQLPVAALGLDKSVEGKLTAERTNPGYRPAAKDGGGDSVNRSALMAAALALAALVLGGAGLRVLRRPSSG